MSRLRGVFSCATASGPAASSASVAPATPVSTVTFSNRALRAGRPYGPASPFVAGGSEAVTEGAGRRSAGRVAAAAWTTHPVATSSACCSARSPAGALATASPKGAGTSRPARTGAAPAAPSPSVSTTTSGPGGRAATPAAGLGATHPGCSPAAPPPRG